MKLNIYLHRVIKMTKDFGILFVIKAVIAKLIYNDRKYSALLESQIYKLFKKEIDNIENAPLASANIERVWTMWWQGEDSLPEVLRLCYNSHKRYIIDQGIEYVMITQDNYRDYIELPEFIFKKVELGIISFTHLSDMFRVCLIEKYGGAWIDITVLLTSPIDRSIFTYDFWSVNMFGTDYTPQHLGQTITECRWAGFLLSANYPHSPLFKYIKNCQLSYWSRFNSPIDYFFTNLFIKVAFNKNEWVRKIISMIPVSNINMYYLQDCLNKEYDEKTWNLLCANTCMFKTTQKVSYLNQVNGEETLYFKLLNYYKK